MKTLRKINSLAFVVFILVSGCASNHVTKTTAINTEPAGADSASDTRTEASVTPESCVKPPYMNDTHWWEYAFMPVTVASRALLWYGDLPGVGK